MNRLYDDPDYIPETSLDDLEPAAEEIDYSNFPIEPPEEEIEPAPEDIDYAGSSIDPAAHDYNSTEEFLAEQEDIQRELDELSEDISNDYIEHHKADKDELSDLVEALRISVKEGTISEEEAASAILDVEWYYNSDSSFDDVDNDADFMDGTDKAGEEEAKRAKYIEKMEEAQKKRDEVDKGHPRDTFVEVQNFKETFYAYKAGVELNDKDVGISDVVSSFLKLEKTNVFETLILRAIDKIEDKIEERKAEIEKEEAEKEAVEKSEAEKDDPDFIDVPEENIESLVDNDNAENKVDSEDKNEVEKEDTENKVEAENKDSEKPEDNDTEKVETEPKDIDKTSEDDISKEASDSNEDVDRNATDANDIDEAELVENMVDAPEVEVEDADTSKSDLVEDDSENNSENHDVEEDNDSDSEVSNESWENVLEKESADAVDDDDDDDEDEDRVDTDSRDVDAESSEAVENVYEIDDLDAPEDIEDKAEEALGNDEEEKNDKEIDNKIGNDEEDDKDFFSDTEYPGFEHDIDTLNNAFKDSSDLDENTVSDVKEALESIADYYDVTIDDAAEMFTDRWQEEGVDVESLINQILDLRDVEAADIIDETPEISFGTEDYAFDVDNGVFDINSGDYVDALNDPDVVNDIESSVMDDVEQNCDITLNDVEINNDFAHDIDMDDIPNDVDFDVDDFEQDVDIENNAIDTEGAQMTGNGMEDVIAEESVDIEEIIAAIL